MTQIGNLQNNLRILIAYDVQETRRNTRLMIAMLENAEVVAIASNSRADSEPLGQYLAENHGVAIVPGAFFSPFGNDWIRFSYATPVERTEGAFKRLVEGLEGLRSS